VQGPLHYITKSGFQRCPVWTTTVTLSQPSGYFNNDGTFQQYEETNKNPLDSCKYHIELLS
jgi:hypothetical protein